MKRFILFVISCMVFAHASAQLSYIFEGGYALSANYSPSPALRHAEHGVQADFSVDYRFKSQPLLGLKMGLGYKFQTYMSKRNHLFLPTIILDEDAQTNEYILDHSVILPVRMTFNFDINDWVIKVLTGPKFCYHFTNAQYDYTTPSQHYLGKSKLDNIYYPFDCLWGIGVGAVYKHVYLELMIDLGLYNRTRRNSATYDDNTFSSREFGITCGYTF